MKTLLLGLFLITFISCGLSKKEKDQIQFYINLHNSSTKLKFNLDSIKEASNIKMKYLDMKGTTELNQYIQSHMKVFANEWNKPYDIKRDRFLTLESYLKYCEAHNYKPKEYIKFID